MISVDDFLRDQRLMAAPRREAAQLVARTVAAAPQLLIDRSVSERELAAIHRAAKIKAEELGTIPLDDEGNPIPVKIAPAMPPVERDERPRAPEELSAPDFSDNSKGLWVDPAEARARARGRITFTEYKPKKRAHRRTRGVVDTDFG